jgi:putative acetyltransferase
MRIRSYREEDGIKEVVKRAVESVEPEKYSDEEQKHLENTIPQMNVDFAEHEDFSYFVAVDDSEIIGVVGFKPESGKVSGIFVEPERNDKGIGSKLLEKIEEEAAEKGIERLEVLSSLEAIYFYQKNGYSTKEPTERDLEGKNIEMMIMEKQIE